MNPLVAYLHVQLIMSLSMGFNVQVHAQCFMWPVRAQFYFIPFYCQMVFHYMNMPHLSIHSSIGRHSVCFQVLVNVNTTIQSQVFVQTPISFLLGIYTQELNRWAIWHLVFKTFQKLPEYFPKHLLQFYIPTSAV